MWMSRAGRSATSGSRSAAQRQGVIDGAPGRVEDWRLSSEGPAYLLLPVSVGSASLAVDPAF